MTRLAMLTNEEVLAILCNQENPLNKARALIAGHCGWAEQQSAQRNIPPIELRRREIECVQKIAIVLGLTPTE